MKDKVGYEFFKEIVLKLGELAFIEMKDEKISIEVAGLDSNNCIVKLDAEDEYKKVEIFKCDKVNNIEWLKYITSDICKQGNLTSLEFKTENYTNKHGEEVNGWFIPKYKNSLGQKEAYLIAELYEKYSGNNYKVVLNGFNTDKIYIFDKNLLKKILNFCNYNEITVENRKFQCYTELEFETDQQVGKVYNECINKISYLTFEEIKNEYKNEYICVVNMRKKSYEKSKYQYAIKDLGGDVYLHSPDYELFKQEIKRLGLGIDPGSYKYEGLSKEQFEGITKLQEKRYVIINNTNGMKYNYEAKHICSIYAHTAEYAKYIRSVLGDYDEFFEEVFVENTKVFKIYSDDEIYYNIVYFTDFDKDNTCDLFSKYPDKFICLGNLNYDNIKELKPMKFYDSNVTAGTVLKVSDNYNDLAKYVRREGLVNTYIMYTGNINNLDRLGNVINTVCE